MATADRILMLRLLGDTSSIDKSLRKTEGRLKGMGRAAGAWGKALVAGLVIEGIDKVADALGDAWTGFREGEKASAQLGTTWKNLGLDGSKLSGTIDAISKSTLALGTDDTEAIMAFNKALQATGGDSKKAMDRLRIAQDLVANGSAPNLTSALGIIASAAKGSAKVVDKFGLTGKTAGDRIKELGDKVKGAAKKAADADPLRVLFNSMSEGLETFVGALSQGDIEGALGGIRDIGQAITDTWTKVFPAIDKAMAKLVGEENWTNAKNLVQGFLDTTSRVFAELGRIWDGLAPHVQNALNLISPLVAGIGQIVGLMGDNIKLVLDAIGDLLDGDFSGAWTAVQGVVANVVAAVQAGVGAMLTFIQGIIPGVLTAAGDIGKGIWDGIMGWVRGIPDAITNLIRGGINAIIGAWNALDFRIPAFEIPKVDLGFDTPFGRQGFAVGPFPVWGSSGDLIPDIPKLASGGIVNRPTLAMIGEAGPEAVVPLGRGGGMGSNYTINVNVAPGGDLVATGKAIVDAIRSYERRSGRAWRT